MRATCPKRGGPSWEGRGPRRKNKRMPEEPTVEKLIKWAIGNPATAGSLGALLFKRMITGAYS